MADRLSAGAPSPGAAEFSARATGVLVLADGTAFEGHAFGNLLIAALVATTGDFVTGIAEACALLNTVGSVFPATSCPVILKAEVAGSQIEGQVRIMGAEGINHRVHGPHCHEHDAATRSDRRR